ncbi:hypothetical protein [Staphylococcus schleiferi]|uniref:hypothetical protein n=1 Tax=Staphylococcus schleiferi TaxID=1295 RepID=UPI0021CE1B0E|nr:hypothetical protein [Staphylococcus schleiferi]UXR54966.1 hypothetical protein MUA46_12220 [Staphylococcus schleiferi]UXR57276.1 hypothetical protein MUA40_11955 [Staphylococcus schleiferi]UXR59561.1 hypothetical protein MUA91_11955 [Staphylococcus schleiferi]UXR61873.1 hypothetical protein MUA72_12180 [Staphylococcus schleiferi]
MKKVIILFLTLIFTTSFVLLYFSESTYANEIEGDNYQSLQQDGILDNTVSEDQWNQFLQESESGKQSLENDSEIVSYSSGFRLKAGDVLISNATSSKGLTGHAAIAISSNQVLHIHSAGHHPAVHSFSWFKKRYSGKGQWLKIYRSKNSKAGPKAAAWAKKNYVGKNIIMESIQNYLLKIQLIVLKLFIKLINMGLVKNQYMIQVHIL